MRPTSKLLLTLAVIVTIAAPAGWKWASTPKKERHAMAYAITLVAVSDPVSAAPSDPSLSPDGWTWDTGE
jgi:hypothetical protein